MFTCDSDSPDGSRTVLWWSRSGRDYSRDRIIRSALRSLGWMIEDFRPAVSRLAHWQAKIRQLKRPDLVWVPCFRQRDVRAASCWAQVNDVPVVFDPLISAWDKQVFERSKFSENSRPAIRLRQWESQLMRSCDRIVADTHGHAEFFHTSLGVAKDRIHVIPVSAEESLFYPQPPGPETDGRKRTLFFGSFIGLQGPEFIAEAAACCPQVDWTFIGNGPQLAACRSIASHCDNVRFLPIVPYPELAEHIRKSDILLGIFGQSEKAARVIPNKVYQSLACGRPVVTRASDSYPDELLQKPENESGISWVQPGSASHLAEVVLSVARQSPDQLRSQGNAAADTYREWFSNESVKRQLRVLLDELANSTSRRNREAA